MGNKTIVVKEVYVHVRKTENSRINPKVFGFDVCYRTFNVTKTKGLLSEITLFFAKQTLKILTQTV